MFIPDKDISKQILVSLRRIIQGIDLHSRSLHRKCGLTSPQIILLEELLDSPKLSVGELAKRISLSHATVTDMLNRLEKSGLIYRKRSNLDRRRVELGITDLGTQALQEAPPLLQDRFIDELEKLHEWERTLILSTLQRIVSMMEIKDVEAAPILASGPIIKTEVTEASEQAVSEESAPGKHIEP
ncbi:MAG: MarR family winged helix-turn-helix transcriptional regulator [Candidatus Glassbacteria bacterium]